MKSEKGFTGADLSIAVIIIVLFIGLIMTIFYQIYLSSSRIQRSTNANNLAISILEKIEAMSYEEVKEGNVTAEGEYQIDNGASNTGTTSDVLKGIFVPKGYTVGIRITNYNQTEGNEGKEDIIKIVKLEIKYKVGRKEEKLEMQTLKEKNKKKVNSPKLAEGMTPIKWNGSTWEETTASDPQWYDYKDTSITGADTSLWANAKTKDGSMWVWIPRYSYCIKSGYHCNGLTMNADGSTNEAGEIDVRFLKGTTDEYYTEQGTADRTPSLNNKDSSAATAMTNYVVHPSFTANSEIGGWDKELEGYWVAKYEASRADSTAEVQGTSETIKIQENVLAAPIILENDIFLKSKNMNQNKQLSADNIEPHQIKNSEWGAVAYLTHSQYGRNGKEVMPNTLNFITGNSNIDLKTTTTGNKTGIYDMSGGLWETSASEFKGIYNENTQALHQETNLKYKNIYTGFDNRMFGDAIYETSSNIGTLKSYAWFQDISEGITAEYFIQSRSGNGKINTANACGMFFHGYYKGSSTGTGMRVVLSF